MFEGVLAEDKKLVNNGIYYVLRESWHDPYDDEFELEEDILGSYLITLEKLKDKPVRKIFEFLTDNSGGINYDFYDLSIKLTDENIKRYNNFYNHGMEGVIALYNKMKKDRSLKYLLDYNLIQLLDLTAHNHHAQNVSIINLKESDTKYDHEQDDLVHDKTFFYANRPEQSYSESLEYSKKIINLFSREYESRSDHFEENSFLKQNYFKNETQIESLMNHNFPKEKKDEASSYNLSGHPHDEGHSIHSENLIFNLILNGDKDSFYKAYHILMSNHSFKEYESSLRKSINLTSRKIHVPWKIESRRESEGDNDEDRYLPSFYIQDQHLISLRKLFFKVLAETAPITYFLDFNYASSELKPYTQAAVTAFLLVGSQNNLLDDQYKKSQFTYSTFIYIFSQIYIRGDLDTLVEISSAKLLKRIEHIAEEYLSVADLKRALRMIVPYSQSEAEGRVRGLQKIDYYLNIARRDGNHEDQKYLIKKRNEVSKSLQNIDSGAKKIWSIFEKELKSRLGVDNIYEGVNSFIEEEDFDVKGKVNPTFNTTEEKLLMFKEQGSVPSKDTILQYIESERNHNLTLFCIKNNFINFEDLPEEYLIAIDVTLLDNIKIRTFKDELLKRDLFKRYAQIFISRCSNNINVKTVNDLTRMEKNLFLKGFIEENVVGLSPYLLVADFYKKNNIYRKSFYEDIVLKRCNNNLKKINDVFIKNSIKLGLSFSVNSILKSIDPSSADYSGLNTLENIAAKKILKNNPGFTTRVIKINWKYIYNLEKEKILNYFKEDLLDRFSNSELIRLNKDGFYNSFDFLGFTFSLEIPLDDCVSFAEKEDPDKNKLFYRYVMSTPELIQRSVDMINKEKIEQPLIKEVLSQKFSYPERHLNPLFEELELNENSFEFILNHYLNPETKAYDLKNITIDNDNLNFKLELENNKQYIYNFIGAKYHGSQSALIGRLNDIYDLNVDSNNLILFILKDIYFFASNFIGTTYGVLEKNEISEDLWNYSSENGKGILFKKFIKSIDKIIFKKDNSLRYHGKYSLSSYQHKERIKKEIFNSSILKILNFLKLEEDKDKINFEISECVDKIGKDTYRSSPLSNSVFYNIKINDEGPFSVQHRVASDFIKNIFDKEKVEILSTDINKFEEISRVFNKYFLEKYSKSKKEKEKFLYLVLSFGIFKNRNNEITSHTLRSLSSNSNVSPSLKNSIRNLFKDRSEKSIIEANNALLPNALVFGDKNIEFLFSNILNKKGADFSSKILNFINLIKSTGNLKNLKTFASILNENKENLNLIKLPLNLSSISSFFEKAVSTVGNDVSKHTMFNVIHTEDVEKFYDFTYLFYSYTNYVPFDSSMNFGKTLEKYGYTFSGIDLSYMKDEFYLGVKDIINHRKAKQGSLITEISKKFGLKKDEVFSKTSQFFKFLKVIKSYEGTAISEDLLASYQPKNYIFGEFNLDPTDGGDKTSDVRLRVIPEKDAYALMVGLDTGCCQHIGGAAENVTIDTLIGRNSGVIMFEHKVDRPSIGHYKSIDEGYQIFGQAFTSIHKGYVILDNIEFAHEGATKDRLYLCLKLLYDKCSSIGYTLICGSTAYPFDPSDFESIRIEDDREIWSGPISETYSDFSGYGKIISFDEFEKESSFVKLDNLSKYIYSIDKKLSYEIFNLKKYSI